MIIRGLSYNALKGSLIRNDETCHIESHKNIFVSGSKWFL